MFEAHQHPSPIRRIALASAAALVAVNIWTGAPLLALWVGSQFTGTQRLSMGAVAIVLIALGVFVGVLVWLLGRLDAAYVELMSPPGGTARVASPWLRSMRSERDDLIAGSRSMNAIERIAIVSASICALALNVWFFFFATWVPVG